MGGGLELYSGGYDTEIGGLIDRLAVLKAYPNARCIRINPHPGFLNYKVIANNDTGYIIYLGIGRDEKSAWIDAWSCIKEHMLRVLEA